MSRPRATARDNSRPACTLPRSARLPYGSASRSCLRPPLALGPDHDPVVDQPLRLQLEPGQRPVLDPPDAEPKGFVRVGELLRKPTAQRFGVDLCGRDLDQDLDLVAPGLLREQVDLELVDLRVLANDRLYRPRIDVRPAHELHVVHPPTDPALVQVERPAARARRTGNLDHEVAGPVAKDRDEAPSERRDHALA